MAGGALSTPEVSVWTVLRAQLSYEERMGEKA